MTHIRQSLLALAFGIVPLAVTGCASEVPAVRGPVVTRANQDATVCLDRGSLSPGEEVRFKRTRCTTSAKTSIKPFCSTEMSGTGQVVEIVDAGCYRVRVAGDVGVRPGDELEPVVR